MILFENSDKATAEVCKTAGVMSRRFFFYLAMRKRKNSIIMLYLATCEDKRTKARDFNP